ncbi:6785_t:CDS:2 [Paraglomus occultum]|uniref:6785_t:CDS:1 n=1 Tax=Paraglomus occultum TaxID=144539 RepID=A0A9N9FNE0_9GLOM|nr:6785_t:CDS:2 [Paraglomus occultum]
MNPLSRHYFTNAQNSFKYCKTIFRRQAGAHRSISTFTTSDYIQRFPKFKDIRALHLRWTRVEHEEYKEKVKLQVAKLKAMNDGGKTQAAGDDFSQQTQSLASSDADLNKNKSASKTNLLI